MLTFMGCLKYTCALDRTDSISASIMRGKGKQPKHSKNSLLHASSSSLSPDSSFETSLFSPPGGRTIMDPYFTSIEDNPEAMFDILTIQSIQERYSDTEKTDPASNKSLDTSIVSDQEFEIFVRDFPIDDSIAECFAAPGDRKLPFLNQGTKSSNNSSKHNKLKKKFLPHRDGHVFSDEESKSSDSKKSKLIGNIFHRKSKAKDRAPADPKKSDDITSVIIDACENITNAYPKPDSASQNSFKKKGDKVESQSKDITQKVHRAQSLTGSVSSDGVSSRKLPSLPRQRGRTKSTDSHKGSLDSGKSKSNQDNDSSYWSSVFQVENSEDMVNKVTSLSRDKLRSMKDSKGNNILHQSVQLNKVPVAVELVQKIPELALERNFEKITPIESAILNGYDMLLAKLVEPLIREGKISVKMISRLMAFSTENGQSKCLENLLCHVPAVGGPPHDLPKGIDGTTVAHIAAARGHMDCLQVLVTNGYTRWTQDSRGFQPMQIAIQNGHMACYHFLLLQECCACLIREVGVHKVETDRYRAQKTVEQNCLESLEQRLLHHCTSLSSAMTTVTETQQNISHSLQTMCTAMEGVLSKMEQSHADALRVNLDNIKAESERLQDLFEFSPLASSNEILSRIVKDFSTALHFEHTDQDGPTFTTDDGQRLLHIVSKKTREDVLAGKGSPCDVTTIVRDHLMSLIASGKHSDYCDNAVENSEINKCSELKTLQNATHGDSLSSHLKVQFAKSESEKHGDSDQGSNRTLTQISTSPVETGSVFSNTMTSGITGTDHTSDWNSRLSTITGDSSGSESDWWEDSRRHYHDDDEHDFDDDDFEDYYDEDDDISFNYVKLNLENEDMPDEILREHRLTQHLKSIERLNTERSDLVETVVTATGRRLGRKDKGAIINETCNVMGRKHPIINTVTTRPVVSRGKQKDKQKRSVKLFSIDDVVSSRELSQSEFLEGYDRSRGRPSDDRRWDELSLTDGEEQGDHSKPWYEMSEDEESIIQSWKSDDDDTHYRGYRNSYI